MNNIQTNLVRDTSICLVTVPGAQLIEGSETLSFRRLRSDGLQPTSDGLQPNNRRLRQQPSRRKCRLTRPDEGARNPRGQDVEGAF